MHARTLALTTLFAAVLGGAAALAAPRDPYTVLVSASRTGSGTGGLNPTISADGRYVVYETTSTVHVPGDSGTDADVVRTDLRLGETVPVSVPRSGTGGGNAFSGAPAVSANGRYVAFLSLATNLVPETVNGGGDIFVRDMETGTTSLVSVNTAGTGGGDGFAVACAISANGRYVAFVSSSTDHVALATNGTLQVYVRDLKKRVTRMVSVNAAGTGGGTAAGEHGLERTFALSVSASGRYVAFTSRHTDLTADTVTGLGDVFVRDVRKGVTVLASVTPGGGGGNGPSIQPYLSASGRTIAFTSFADDLTSVPVPDNQSAIYVRDLKRRTTVTASLDASGTSVPPLGAYAPTLSANGRTVCFSSDSDGIVPSDANGATDVFVRDLGRDVTTLVSVNAAGDASGNAFSESSVLTPSGRFVTFVSQATNLTQDTVAGMNDVFVRVLR